MLEEGRDQPMSLPSAQCMLGQPPPGKISQKNQNDELQLTHFASTASYQIKPKTDSADVCVIFNLKPIIAQYV